MTDTSTYSRQFLEVLAENIQAMVAYVDPDQRYVFANALYIGGFGLTPSEVVGKHVKEVLGEANHEAIRDKLEEALAGRKASYQRDIPLDNGTTLHFHADYLPHCDALGKVLGCFVLIQDLKKSYEFQEGAEISRIHLDKIADARTTELLKKDIADRKNTAQLLKKTNLELEQILNTVENGIALIDTNHNIMRVNQAMLAQSKLTEEKVLGRKCHDIFQVTVCHTDICPLQQILKGAPFVQIESVRQCLDGSRFPCEVTAKPLLDTEGNLIGMVENVRDITGKIKRQKENELLLQQAIQSDKLASLGTVVAGVAHEINNPNSFIAYNAPMAEKIWQGVKPVLDEYAARNPQWRVGPFSYQEVTESMTETLQFIKTGSERINAIVTNLKDFAGLDSEQNDSLVQINSIINQAYTIIGAQLRKKVGTIVINLDADLPEIYGQFQRLEQVVINLMLNAMDAIDDKKAGHITVTSKYIARLQAVLITVEDNGRGMKKDVLDHIFDPFFTTRREQGGTGLGLSVSFGLIKEHHGTLSVLSRPGRGSRFTICLPLDKRLQEKVTLSPTILCIDDDKPVLQFIETFFRGATGDFTIATRDNPQHILTYLEEHPEVDLVISEVMMPNMNGWDLLAEIKNKFPLMPVTLISGDPTALEQRPGAPTPDHILQKPLGLQELRALIKNIDRRIL
ncbi:MAG: PAS domain-containing protein [Proteobacteria bacterium]|nr:PAS domain-containing protein [Pseudomonadota bacterium]